MNNIPSPAMTSKNDLVLQLTGGDRDGQLLPVRTAKCLLSSLIRDEAVAEKHRCAIFRGSKGVAFRSYSDHVLVNGSKVSVQWLKQGDLISLTPDLTVVVKQLGVFDAANVAPENAQPVKSASRKVEGTVQVNPGLLPKDAQGRAASVRPVEVTAPVQSMMYAQNAPPAAGSEQTPTVDSKPNVASARGPVVTQAVPVTPATSANEPSARGPAVTQAVPVQPATTANNPAARSPVVTQAVPVKPATTADVPTAEVSQAPESTSPTNTTASVEVPSLVTPPAPETISDSVDERMNSLSDRLSTLVDAASGTPDAGSTPAQTSAELEKAKLAAASASIQNFLDNALVSNGESKDTSATETSNAQAAAPRLPEVTQELEAKPSPVSEVQSPFAAVTETSALRREEVTSSLERLLGGTAVNLPTTDDKASSANAISAAEQMNSAASAPEIEHVEPIEQDKPVEQAESNEQALSYADKLLADAEISQPAETAEPESKVRSLDFLKSLGVDASELGLNSDQPASPINEPQLVADASTAIESTSAIEAAPSVADAEVNPDTAENTDDQPATEAVESLPEPVAPTQKAESVADVLARMQNAGSLSSFNLDATEEEPTAATSEPEPSLGVTKTEVDAVTDESIESVSGSGDDENAVEDYMSQLLNRMRGGDEEPAKESSAIAQPKPQKIETKEANASSTGAFTPEPELEKLTKEEFVPKQKAVRMQSLDSLREIANNSSRLAIQDHLANQRKVATQTKLQLTIISLIFGVICFAMSCLFSPKIVIGGMLFGLAFLVMGVVMGYLYREERKLDESLISEQK